MTLPAIRALIDRMEAREDRLIDAVLVLLDTIDNDSDRHGGLQSQDTQRVAGDVRALIAKMMLENGCPEYVALNAS